MRENDLTQTICDLTSHVILFLNFYFLYFLYISDIIFYYVFNYFDVFGAFCY